MTEDNGRTDRSRVGLLALVPRPSSFVNRPRVPSMIIVRSRWLLPIADRPMLNGWVAIDRGRIAAAGRAGASLPSRDDAPLVDLGAYAVLPALVNAHVHLELSWLRGRVPRAESVHRLGAGDAAAAHDSRAGRRRRPGGGRRRHRRDARVGHGAGRRHLELAGRPSSRLRRSTLDGVVFHEVLRLAADAADDVLERRVARAGSARDDGTVSREPGAARAVLRVAATVPGAACGAGADAVSAVIGPPRRVAGGSRVARDGGGALASSCWSGSGPGIPRWTPPACSPVAYLEQMRVLDSRLLAVHLVECSDDDLDAAAGAGHDRRHVSAKQPLRRRRRPAGRRGSTGPVSPWRWGPTAWRATTT